MSGNAGDMRRSVAKSPLPYKAPGGTATFGRRGSGGASRQGNRPQEARPQQ